MLVDVAEAAHVVQGLHCTRSHQISTTVRTACYLIGTWKEPRRDTMLERTTMSGRLLMMPSPPVGAVAMLLDLAEMQARGEFPQAVSRLRMYRVTRTAVRWERGGRGIRVLLPCARDPGLRADFLGRPQALRYDWMWARGILNPPISAALSKILLLIFDLVTEKRIYVFKK